MKTAIILNGYARSGKSTALGYLSESYNIPTVSTSQILHNTAEDLLKSIGCEYNSYNRNNTISFKATTDEGISEASWNNRDFLITLAEEILVKNFGREIFGLSLAKAIIDSNSDYVLGETIGGNEWFVAGKALKDAGVKVVTVNIRSQSEMKGVDIRELFEEPDYSIQNALDASYFRKLDVLMRLIMQPASI